MDDVFLAGFVPVVACDLRATFLSFSSALLQGNLKVKREHGAARATARVPTPLHAPSPLVAELSGFCTSEAIQLQVDNSAICCLSDLPAQRVDFRPRIRFLD